MEGGQGKALLAHHVLCVCSLPMLHTTASLGAMESHPSLSDERTEEAGPAREAHEAGAISDSTDGGFR